MKNFNWTVYLSLIIGELVLISLLVFQRGKSYPDRAEELVTLILWASIPALGFALPTWKYRSRVGPLPGPLLTFGLGGIGSLLFYYSFFAHYVAVVLLFGFLIQCVAAIFNFIGLKSKSNYAIKPIAEQALGSNRTISCRNGLLRR